VGMTGLTRLFRDQAIFGTREAVVRFGSVQVELKLGHSIPEVVDIVACQYVKFSLPSANVRDVEFTHVSAQSRQAPSAGFHRTS